MKTKTIAVLTILCLASGSAALARDHGHYRSYSPHYYHRHHHDDNLGIVLGVAGGLLVGSALIGAFTPSTPPPPAVVYQAPPVVYQPEVVVRQPSVCFEDRVVEGEWQVSRGRQVWVQFPYPVNRRVEVPCY